MKKILLSIVGFCLCAICAFSAVGCKPADYGITSTDTSKVVGNGGSTVLYDGNLYFANGIGTNDGEHNGGTIGSIYKVAVDQDGKIAEDAKYTKVVDALVGYNKGSINIIGDFLYYTTPGVGENKTGEILYKKTRFMRKNLVNGKTQEIYKTADNNADEAVTFAYYKTGENFGTLNLVVYEATSKTLKSFKIGNEIETVFSKENITSAVFSETMGSTTDCAENFVFYTMAADENAVDTSTNRVYRIGADGSNETLINDNASLTLEGVRAGKLIVNATFGSVKNTYAVPVTTQTQNGDVKIADPSNSKNPHQESFKYVISCNEYSTLMYINEADGSIAILYLEGLNLIYEKFGGNTSSSVSYIIHTFGTTPTMKFVGTFADSHDENNGYAIFINKVDSKNIVYKIRYTFENEEDCLAERQEPEKLTTTDAKVESSDSSSSDSLKLGNMLPEVIGNYVYIFASDEDKNVLLHRVNVYTPTEIKEQTPPTEEPGDGAEGEEEEKEDLSIKAAELVGGAEI